jgi:hypothetical protein
MRGSAEVTRLRATGSKSSSGDKTPGDRDGRIELEKEHGEKAELKPAFEALHKVGVEVRTDRR